MVCLNDGRSDLLLSEMSEKRLEPPQAPVYAGDDRGDQDEGEGAHCLKELQNG